jgi:hypothetical protein
MESEEGAIYRAPTKDWDLSEGRTGEEEEIQEIN